MTDIETKMGEAILQGKKMEDLKLRAQFLCLQLLKLLTTKIVLPECPRTNTTTKNITPRPLGRCYASLQVMVE